MKKDSFFTLRIYPVLFMVLITAFCICLTSGIFLYTQDRVIVNESLFLKKAILYTSNIDIPDSSFEIEALFNETIVEEKNKDIVSYYVTKSNVDENKLYTIIVAGPGLWGQIESVVTFEADLKTVKGIEFTKQNETPGLGARISELWFKEQFRGKQGPFEMVEEGTQNKTDNQVDALTGATRTSNLVLDIINNAESLVKNKVGGN